MATNENLIPIPGRLHSVATEGHVAGADEIYDDNYGQLQDGLNKAILEEKEYTPANYSGMGRVVLQKNMVSGVNTLTQDMFYKGAADSRVPNINTIYVIQYDFTLGEDITVPANCVLEFDGGSLIGDGTNKNTIISDDVEIVSDGYCLKNIHFSGRCTLRNFKLAWWIKKYPKYTNDKTVDNTLEIQSAFDSGVLNLVFPTDKYLYITNTIVYEGCMNILADIYKPCDPDTQNAAGRPCLFTDTVVTMLHYKYNTVSNFGSRSLYIGTIDFCCFTPFSDLTKYETPVIYIESKSPMWGITIDANIRGNYSQIDNVARISYTGIKFKANTDNYISMIKLRGIINLLYYGYIFIPGNGNGWMSAIDISGRTYCAYGVKPTDVDLQVSGTHQVIASLSNPEPELGYFSSSSILYTGYVWDTGTHQRSNGLYAAAKEICLNQNVVQGETIITPGYYDREDIFNKATVASNIGINKFRYDVKGDNILNEVLRGDFYGITDFSLKINNVEDYSLIKRIDNLFPTALNYTEGVPQVITSSNACLDSIAENDILTYSFKLDIAYIQARDLMMYLKSKQFVFNLNIVNDGTGDVYINKSFDRDYLSYNNFLGIVQLPVYNVYGNNIYTVTVTCTAKYSVNDLVPLPFISIPVQHYKTRPVRLINTAKFGVPVYTNFELPGQTIMNTTDKKIRIHVGGNSWVYADGTPVS